MKEENNFDKIEAFLFNQLSDAERIEFEQELLNNKGLQEEVKLHHAEHQAMEVLLQQDLRSEMNSWKEEKNQQAQAPVVKMKARRFTIYQLAAAASVALLIGFFGIYQLNNNFDHSRLANNYFNETSITDRGSNTTQSGIPDQLANGIRAMQKQDYTTAIPAFLQVDQEEYLSMSNILLAECYFQTRQYDKVLASTSLVIDKKEDKDIVEKAEWYRTLALLASEQETEGRRLLEKIKADPEHNFNPYAIKLSDEMDSFLSRIFN